MHRWYRLVSLESFTAGCPCGWVSPERDTADEMMRDVERRITEGAASRDGTRSFDRLVLKVIHSKRFGSSPGPDCTGGSRRQRILPMAAGHITGW